MNTKQRKEIAAFIRENRSNEGNFEALRKKLREEIAGAGDAYRQQLQEIETKRAEEYLFRKQDGGSAWPEFEKFVSEFEKVVMDASKTSL